LRIYWSLINLWKENSSSSILVILPNQRGCEGWRFKKHLWNSHNRSVRLTKGLKPKPWDYRVLPLLPTSPSHCKVLLAIVPFVWNITINKSLQSILKGKKTQLEETEQALEADSYMTVMLKLSEQEFKTIMIIMLRALMFESDSVQKRWEI
jgi:hypothetical protein